jgi:hypothetical protein
MIHEDGNLLRARRIRRGTKRATFIAAAEPRGNMRSWRQVFGMLHNGWPILLRCRFTAAKQLHAIQLGAQLVLEVQTLDF